MCYKYPKLTNSPIDIEVGMVYLTASLTNLFFHDAHGDGERNLPFLTSRYTSNKTIQKQKTTKTTRLEIFLKNVDGDTRVFFLHNTLNG